MRLWGYWAFYEFAHTAGSLSSLDLSADTPVTQYLPSVSRVWRDVAMWRVRRARHALRTQTGSYMHMLQGGGTGHGNLATNQVLLAVSACAGEWRYMRRGSGPWGGYTINDMQQRGYGGSLTQAQAQELLRQDLLFRCCVWLRVYLCTFLWCVTWIGARD